MQIGMEIAKEKYNWRGIVKMKKIGVNRDLNPGPLRPKRRMITTTPLTHVLVFVLWNVHVDVKPKISREIFEAFQSPQTASRCQTENAQWMPFVIIVKLSLWWQLFVLFSRQIVYYCRRDSVLILHLHSKLYKIQKEQTIRIGSAWVCAALQKCCVCGGVFVKKALWKVRRDRVKFWWTPRILGLCIHDDLPQQQIYSFLYLLSPLFL